jgi:transketolase
MELSEQSKAIRRQILTEAYNQKHGHIASCFSCVEILLAIKEIMKPEDFFILSKGHAILAEIAVFGKEISCFKTGSLGHGIGVGAGIALANPDSRVYVVVGDGELQEGSCYEALSFIINMQLTNIIIFIDKNGYQASRKVPNGIDLDIHIKPTIYFPTGICPIHQFNGNNLEEMLQFFKEGIYNIAMQPIPKIFSCITKKGMGVSFIETDPVRWHTEIPSESDFVRALKELS